MGGIEITSPCGARAELDKKLGLSSAKLILYYALFGLTGLTETKAPRKSNHTIVRVEIIVYCQAQPKHQFNWAGKFISHFISNEFHLRNSIQ